MDGILGSGRLARNEREARTEPEKDLIALPNGRASVSIGQQ